MKRLKRIWKRYAEAEFYTHVAICVFCISLILSFTRYAVPFDRMCDALVDFVKSLAYYFVFLFEGLFEKLFGYIPKISLALNELPDVNVNKYLPFSISELQQKFSNLFPGVFDLKNFGDYNIFLISTSYKVLLYFPFLILSVILFFYIFCDGLLRDNKKPLGYFSKPLRGILNVVRRVVKPCANEIKRFYQYVCCHRKFMVVFVGIWLINLNIITIMFDLAAFYFYFISSFDILVFPIQFLKLVIDILIMFSGAPLLFWIIAFGIVYFRICCIKGYQTLRHMDACNCGFLKKISYVSLLIGSPGVGKTTLLTSFCLYFVNIYKKDSLDTLYDIEMTFPGFPFAVLRRELDERMNSHLIYNGPTAELYIESLENVYKATPAACFLFGYDLDLFAMEKDVGNRLQTLFGALRTYAKAYFIYMNENPSISNYPIRFDGEFDDSEYLKLWDGDFYDRKPKEIKEKSRYSHILNQDHLRLGKKMDPDNPSNGCFSFGIYSNTEWGKCRGNQLTTADLRKDDEIVNQKNDLYAYSHKMARHANTTVANKVYFRFIGDEQRPESLAADQRDLCDIISIQEKSEIKLALPGFAWLDKLYDKIYDPFKDFHFDYSNARGDMCLSMFLMKAVISTFSNFYKKLYNRFGYYTIQLVKEKGTTYGNSKGNASEPEIYTYYLPVMQVYSDRYSTDCYSGFFTKKQLEIQVGINDLECYTGLIMNEAQMKEQRDYFLNEIMEIMQEHCGDSQAKTKDKKRACKSSKEYDFEIQEF